jgi:hypothetical protein
MNPAAALPGEENKNKYETPRLVQYGSIHAITSTAASGPISDARGFMI